jgi:glucose-1-phosphate cytidylyltransferase
LKVVILAGGRGTRLAEETVLRPKPMVQIGEKPILWHIMMHYSRYGIDEFLIALGYKGEMIKSFFADEMRLRGSVTVDYSDRSVQRLETGLSSEDKWRVHLVETGLDTQTGVRLRTLRPMVGNETFMMTFSDGVSNVDLNKLLEFHKSHGRLATVTTVAAPTRFGVMRFEGDEVISFEEKPRDSATWISGGFFVLESGVFDYLDVDRDFSKDCLPLLAADGQLMAYKHDSFWQCMDTIQERNYLEALWIRDQAPWKTW